MLRVVFADDHEILRDGLRLLLNRLAPDVDILEAADTDSVLAMLTKIQPPDLVILDIVMEGTSGLDGLRMLRESHPDLPVVMMSAVATPAAVAEAFRLGANGFLPKTMAPEAMLDALRLVLSGQKYLPPLLSLDPSAPAEAEDSASAAVRPIDRLSGRERDVLRLLLHGLPNREIARQLNLGEVTVKAHLKGIFRKLEVNSRTQAVRTALDSGWHA